MQHRLTQLEWDAVAEAESYIYAQTHGAHAYTSVNIYEESQGSIIEQLWNHAYEYVTENHPYDDYNGRGIEGETARRVAESLTILAFGMTEL